MFDGKLIVLGIAVFSQLMGTIKENSHLITDAQGTDDIWETIQTIIEGTAMNAVEELKDTIANAIPALDPLDLDDLKFSLNISQIIEGDLKLSRPVITGLMNFNLTRFKVNLMPSINADYEITFNNADIITEYDLKMLFIQGVDLFGKGVMAASIDDLKLSGSIAIKSTEFDSRKLFLVETFEFLPNLDRTKIIFTGLRDDSTLSELIAQELMELIPSAINGNAAAINEIIGPVVVQFINKVAAFVQF